MTMRARPGVQERRDPEADAEAASDRAGAATTPDGPTVVLESLDRASGTGGDDADRTVLLDPATADQPLIDRAGDALARQPRDLWARYRRLEEHQRGILTTALALVLFLLVVAVLSGWAGG
jgi:hypothetical protein